MKFSQSLKHVKVGETVPGTALINSGRYYLCDVCRKELTGWRFFAEDTFPPIPVCSDECLDFRNEDVQDGPTPVA